MMSKIERLREEAEGVKDGGVKWVTQMGNPVVEWALSGGSCLDSKPKECNHGKTSMFDLCQLKGGLLLGVAC